MRIGLIADAHDRVPAIAELVRRMQAAGVGMVLHAGDYCSPFSLAPFSEANVSVAGVFGRNDGDQEGIRAKAVQGMGVELYESPHSVEIGGKRVLVVHDIGEVNDRSLDEHALVVHGCTHEPSESRRGDVLIVNPGEACGWLSGTPTAAILDLNTFELEWLRLEGPEWKF